MQKDYSVISKRDTNDGYIVYTIECINGDKKIDVLFHYDRPLDSLRYVVNGHQYFNTLDNAGNSICKISNINSITVKDKGVVFDDERKIISALTDNVLYEAYRSISGIHVAKTVVSVKKYNNKKQLVVTTNRKILWDISPLDKKIISKNGYQVITTYQGYYEIKDLNDNIYYVAESEIEK